MENGNDVTKPCSIALRVFYCCGLFVYTPHFYLKIPPTISGKNNLKNFFNTCMILFTFRDSSRSKFPINLIRSMRQNSIGDGLVRMTLC